MVDGGPAEATFDVVAVEDRAHVPVRYVKLATVVVAMVVVAVAASNLLVAPGDVAQSGPAVSPSPAPSLTAAPRPSPKDPTIDPGLYDIALPEMRIRLTTPAGWSSAEAGTAIYKPDGRWRYPDTATPSLAVHAVTRVVTDTCPSGPELDLPFEDVGPTVEDLTAALVNQVGPIRRSGPTDVKLGGYPAKEFILTYDLSAPCGGPEGRLLWENATGSGFGLLKNGTATIYVVDVNGDRLVIASHYRGASAEDIAQLDAIIASMDIEPLPYIVGLPIGRQSLTVDGVLFSFEVTTRTEDGWARYGSVSINKSIQGPQGAEGIIYWTGFPDGDHADPCVNLLSLPVGPSAADLAAAVAAAPGTELVTGPSDVTVGGRAAKHVVVAVRQDLGCDPGFFYAWQELWGGPMWGTTDVGDTIGVWIVDVDGTRLFIAAETRPSASPELEQEMQQIIDSIQFE